MVRHKMYFLHSVFILQIFIEYQHVTGIVLDVWKMMENRAIGFLFSQTDSKHVCVGGGGRSTRQKITLMHAHLSVS